jgi:hypothetical protein
MTLSGEHITQKEPYNMNVIETLENNVTQWQQAIDERTERAAFLRGECDRLVSETIDLTESKARKASEARAANLTELELIEAQLSELHRRHEVAKQAVKEYQLTQAQEAYAKAEQEARAKRLELNAALDERLHFMNRGGRGETNESVEARKQIEIKVATAQAAVTIANRNLAEAGAALRAVNDG